MDARPGPMRSMPARNAVRGTTVEATAMPTTSAQPAGLQSRASVPETAPASVKETAAPAHTSAASARGGRRIASASRM